MIEHIPTTGEATTFKADEWAEGHNGLELKERERQRLNEDITRFLKTGKQIQHLERQPPTIEPKPPKKTRRRRARTSLAKLSKDDVREIRQTLYAQRKVDYKTFEWIATKYDTTAANVWAIWHKKTWKDVEG